MKVKSVMIGALLVLSVSFSVVAQIPTQDQRARIHGIIESANAQTFVLKSQDGQLVSVMLAPDVQIMANAKSSLADIKPGDFVGSAANKGPDGRLHAEEVHIFPAALRGRGEGHRLMGPDLNRTMTNGTVAEAGLESRTMTNGTVSGVSGSSGRILTIKYKGGEQTIEVAPDTPIVTLVIGDRSLLKPGASVSIVATQNDGGLTATSITAEKDGVKPR